MPAPIAPPTTAPNTAPSVPRPLAGTLEPRAARAQAGAAVASCSADTSPIFRVAFMRVLRFLGRRSVPVSRTEAVGATHVASKRQRDCRVAPNAVVSGSSVSGLRGALL